MSWFPFFFSLQNILVISSFLEDETDQQNDKFFVTFIEGENLQSD